MSEEHYKAFLDKAQADITLQEKLKAAKDPKSVTTIAKKKVSISLLTTSIMLKSSFQKKTQNRLQEGK